MRARKSDQTATAAAPAAAAPLPDPNPLRLCRADDGTPCTIFNKRGLRLGDVATVAEAKRCLYFWLNAWRVYQSGEVILRFEDWTLDP